MRSDYPVVALPANPDAVLRCERRRITSQDYVVLEQLDRLSGGELAQVLIRQGSAGLSLTICPECGPHGAFRHREGCAIETANASARAAEPRVDAGAVRRYLADLRERITGGTAIARTSIAFAVAREITWILVGMPVAAGELADHEAHYLRRALAGERAAPPPAAYPPPRPEPSRPCDVPHAGMHVEIDGCDERAAAPVAITSWCAGIILAVALAAGAWRAWRWYAGGVA